MRYKLTIVFLSIAVVSWLAGQDKKEDKKEDKNESAPSFKPGAASSYASHQTIGKLKLAAVKYESDTETKTAFGKLNPNEYGVLPVLLILDNGGDQNLLLDRMEVQLQMPERLQVDPTAAPDLPYIISPKAPNTGPKYPNPIPITFKKKNPLAAIELDIRKFAAKSLLPRDSANGFFYFQARYRTNSILYVTGIREAATGKEVFFAEIPLDSPAQ